MAERPAVAWMAPLKIEIGPVGRAGPRGLYLALVDE